MIILYSMCYLCCKGTLISPMLQAKGQKMCCSPASGNEQGAVAIAEESEVVAEGVVVDIVPCVADEGADEQ